MNDYPKGSVWTHPNMHILAEVVRGEVEFEGERFIVTSMYTADRTSNAVTFNTVGSMRWRLPKRLEGAALEQLHRNQREPDPSKWVKP